VEQVNQNTNKQKDNKGILRGIPQEPLSPDKVDKAEMAFKLYDKDKDGYVTKGEMNNLARKLTRDQIDKVMFEI
jgi:Ca2+-binding EF-hand superfamily protein